MKKAFTLLELLVVMGIIGLMGTISVGGYRAMQRGMEERGVLQNVNTMLRAAYQRAQIDRQPVVVYFWNETLRESNAEQNEIVVGRAVAVRRYGRFSDKEGNCLIDEFADLDKTYQTSSQNGSTATMYIYPVDDLSDKSFHRSLVLRVIKDKTESVTFLTSEYKQENIIEQTKSSTSSRNTGTRDVRRYGFEIKDQGGVSWKPGMAYGMEFMELTLPQNYIFGRNYSSSVQNSVQEIDKFVFEVKKHSGSAGSGISSSSTGETIEICSLRQKGASLEVNTVGKTSDPAKELQ